MTGTAFAAINGTLRRSVEGHGGEVDIPMGCELDERYPRVASYVAGLPAGLESYPECQARVSIYQAVIAGSPESLPLAKELPPPIDELLSGHARGLWVPETILLGSMLAIGDHCRLTPSEHFVWILEQNRRMFRSVVYRAIMAFCSPQLLIEKASDRWGNFHRGTELRAEKAVRNEVSFQLSYPSGLLNATLAELFAAVFTAATEHARGKGVTVAVREVTETNTSYQMRWK